MLDRNESGKIVEKRPNISGPWSHLIPQPPPRPTNTYTPESFLAEVVLETEYQLSDVIAIGIGTTQRSQERGMLRHLYLTPAGLEDITRGSTDPYTLLKNTLQGPDSMVFNEDTLADVVQMTRGANQHLIDWSVKGKKRVVVIYSQSVPDRMR